MQRTDRWPDEYDPNAKSRPGSRRNSASLSRRSSKKEGKSPSTSSANTTPKKVTKAPEFLVTGRQCLKKSDRANSLPGYNRRPSVESKKKPLETPKRAANTSQSSKSRETSLEDDMFLDLSQVSDFEDTNSKYGIKTNFVALATSTPKPRAKPRTGSLQAASVDSRRGLKLDGRLSRDSTFSSASQYRCTASTELDYSSVSPEYSGQSSTEMSPRAPALPPTPPHEPGANLSSCCGSSWQDCSELDTAVGGEWSTFWANYNKSLSRVPVQSYYDQCPTPYRTEDIDLADLEYSTDGSKKRSPEDIENINYIIRNEGLHLTPRETQNMIKCAHILGNVLSKAIERRCREKDVVEERIHEVVTEKDSENPELDSKKKTLTLDLKETNIPAVVKEEKRCETVTTQTDISLPNTKSAPRIFEKILKQLSKSSLDEGLKGVEKAIENKEQSEEKDLAKKED